MVLFFPLSCATMNLQETLESDLTGKTFIEEEISDKTIIEDSMPLICSSEGYAGYIMDEPDLVLFSEVADPAILHDFLPLNPLLRNIELKKRYFRENSLRSSPYPDNTVTAIGSTANLAFAGTMRGGVFMIDPEGLLDTRIMKPLNTLYNRSVTAFLADEYNNRLYIGTYSGLYLYDMSKNTLSILNESLRDRSAIALSLFRGKIIWSTVKGDLLALDDSGLPILYIKGESVINTMLNYDDYLLIGQSSGSILISKEEKIFFEWFNLNEKFSDRVYLNDMLIFHDRLYLLTSMGLIIIDRNGDIINHLLPGETLLEGIATERYIYCATHSSGVIVYDTINGNIKRWDLKIGVPSLHIPAIGVLKNKVILSIPEKGILLIDEELQEKL